MNLTKFAVLFLVISLPFYFITDTSLSHIQQETMLSSQYNTIINNAIDDGLLALKLYSKFNYGNTEEKDISIDPKEVVNAFISSYDYGFGAIGKLDKIRVESYIVALVIMGYDGFYLYRTQEVIDEVTGLKTYRQMLTEKMPYMYKSGNKSVKMTLGDQVYVLDTTPHVVTGEWQSARGLINQSEVQALLPLSMNASNYTSIRERVIEASIKNALEEAVTVHNKYTASMGMTYYFHIPLGKGGHDNATFDDLGLMVFVQGQAIGQGQAYEMSAFAQSNIVLSKSYTGYEELNPSGDSMFYYCNQGCSHSHINRYDSSLVNQVTRIFTSEEEAASEGYWPCKYAQ